MAKKRTKAEKLQRNVERVEERDAARRENEIKDNQSEPARTLPNPAQIEEQIRRRAYELYEARGQEDGHALDDWLQTEAEILGTQRKTIAA